MDERYKYRLRAKEVCYGCRVKHGMSPCEWIRTTNQGVEFVALSTGQAIRWPEDEIVFSAEPLPRAMTKVKELKFGQRFFLRGERGERVLLRGGSGSSLYAPMAEFDDYIRVEIDDDTECVLVDGENECCLCEKKEK